MPYENILYEKEGKIAIITINRPDKLNALNRKTMQEINEAILSAGSDDIQQISDILSNYQDVSAIHIISHGSPGQVQIGSVELNATSLDFYAERIQAWGDALTHDGDILLYGCSIAQGDMGLDVIRQIAELSGADVAASDDPTGSTDLGGDWILESLIGPVEASLLPWDAVAEFQGLLAVTIATSSP